MEILPFKLGPLQTNCYFLIKDGKCLIIDPVDSADFILEEVLRRKLELVGLLATHGHFDHIMATGEIQLSFNLPLHIAKEDMFLVKRLKETSKYFLSYDPTVIQPKNFKHISEGDMSIGDFSFKILETPGHTPGSVSYYFPEYEDGVVFTGDTIFLGSVGEYDHAYSSKEDLKKSIAKIYALPDATEIMSGHGEETRVLFEKQWQWPEAL